MGLLGSGSGFLGLKTPAEEQSSYNMNVYNPPFAGAPAGSDYVDGSSLSYSALSSMASSQLAPARSSPPASTAPVYGAPQQGFLSFLGGLFSNSSPPPAPSAVPYTKDQSRLPGADDWLSAVMDPGIGTTYSVTPLPDLPAPSLPASGLNSLAPIASLGRKILPVLKSQSSVSQSGSIVSSAQSALNALGYNTGSVDGLNGSKTTAAVKAFQSANGLTVDGIIGPQTTAALAKATTAKTKAAKPAKQATVTSSKSSLSYGQTPNQFGNILDPSGSGRFVPAGSSGSYFEGSPSGLGDNY